MIFFHYKLYGNAPKSNQEPKNARLKEIGKVIKQTPSKNESD